MIEFKTETHEYFVDSIKKPCVSDILAGAGLIDLSFINKIKLQKASKFGKAIHLACQLWDLNKLDMSSVSAPLIPYLNNWKKFVKDYNILHFAKENIERIIYSKIWDYAGTLDRVAFIDNKKIIIDIKSGSLYPTTAIQLAGYSLAYTEMTKIIINQRWIVQLNKKSYKVTECKEQSDESVFIGAVQVYKYKLKNNLIRKNKNEI